MLAVAPWRDDCYTISTPIQSCIMIDLPVLVLNQTHEPLNLCRVRRAMILIFDGKAEALENGRGELHSITRAFQIPSVVRLTYFVHRPRLQKKLTRFEIFQRDHYTCQYCGHQTKELTLDHVIPRKQGGKHSWDNIVSACTHCNHRKGGRTPNEAGMKLLHKPSPPHNNGISIPYPHLNGHAEWQKYLPHSHDN